MKVAENKNKTSHWMFRRSLTLIRNRRRKQFKEKNWLSHPFLRSVAPNTRGNGSRVKKNKVKPTNQNNLCLD